jgi:hypothetical protein
MKRTVNHNPWLMGVKRPKQPCKMCGKLARRNCYGTMAYHKCPHGTYCGGVYNNHCEACHKAIKDLADGLFKKAEK